LALLFLVAALGGVAALAFANLAGSTFEGNDGNLEVDTAGNADWANAPNRVAGLDKPSGKTDNSFGQGTKEDDPNVTVVTGSIPPNKNDLTRFYVGSEFANGDNYLYLAWERLVNIGSANLDLEINQEKTAGFTKDSTGPLAINRTAGDLLVTYDFGGSGEPSLALLTWIGKNGSASDCFTSKTVPCWGKRVDLSAAKEAEGAVNEATVTDPISPEAGRKLTKGLFGEAAINLTKAGVFPKGTCKAFGSAFLKSRSSASFPAEVKDFIAPEPVNISNCGTVRIIKKTSPRGVDQDFDFSSTIPSSSTCVEDETPAGFTLNDDGNTNSNSAANTEKCTEVPSGTYTATEGADPAGFTFDKYACEAEGSGTSFAAGETAKQVSITVAPNGVVTCVYTNVQNLGAIRITKTRKHVAEGVGETHPFAGVEFTVNGESAKTNAKGVVCFDKLPWSGKGTEYTIKETVPSGYVVDGGNNKVVTVDNSASCSDSTYTGETIAINNTPLTDITVSVNSQVDGGTKSDITCKDSGNETIASGTTEAKGDGSVDAEDLLPGEYTCTVIVDP
jgi:hypothetical protein